jgi:hypothetical protein
MNSTCVTRHQFGDLQQNYAYTIFTLIANVILTMVVIITSLTYQLEKDRKTKITMDQLTHRVNETFPNHYQAIPFEVEG